MSNVSVIRCSMILILFRFSCAMYKFCNACALRSSAIRTLPSCHVMWLSSYGVLRFMVMREPVNGGSANCIL